MERPAGPAEPSIAAAERRLIERAPPRAELGHDPVDLNADRFSSGAWQKPFEDSSFEPLEQAGFVHTQTLDRDGVLAFFRSMGWLGDLPAAERERLIDEVGRALPDDRYVRPWRAQVCWTRLAPTSAC